jgi:CRP/FNR family transcriptional regulator, anaerobic regulatory protein
MGLPTNPIDVPMSRNDIVDYLGLTTETVSRTLTRLKQTKMISLPANKQIGIIDRDGLAEIVARILKS